jgi:DedD protein
MGLFSFLSKNKQESAGEDSGFYSRAGDDEVAAVARSKRASSAGGAAGRRGKQASAAPDPVLPEKKRARRRLVGAIALALAVAVGLPMLLDAEPKPLASDIDIQIPSKDKSVPALPVPAAAPAAAVSAAESLDKKEEIVAAPRDVAEVRLANGKVDVKPAVAKPAAKAPEARPAVKPEEKTAAKTEEKTPAKPLEAASDARALAILEGKQDAPAAQKFVVQVASLASQEKVSELQDKLKEAGIKSYTQKVPGKNGELIRVRVGPFGKDEAEKVRAKLGKAGLPGTTMPL